MFTEGIPPRSLCAECYQEKKPNHDCIKSMGERVEKLKKQILQQDSAIREDLTEANILHREFYKRFEETNIQEQIFQNKPVPVSDIEDFEKNLLILIKQQLYPQELLPSESNNLNKEEELKQEEPGQNA